MKLEIKDKHGKELNIGDYVQGLRRFCDGRLKKNFPRAVREISQVVWNRHRGAYELAQICAHPEDRAFVQERSYRSILYSLEVSNESFENGGKKREDMRALSLEKLDALEPGKCDGCREQNAIFALGSHGEYQVCRACAEKPEWQWEWGKNVFHRKNLMPFCEVTP